MTTIPSPTGGQQAGVPTTTTALLAALAEARDRAYGYRKILSIAHTHRVLDTVAGVQDWLDAEVAWIERLEAHRYDRPNVIDSAFTLWGVEQQARMGDSRWADWLLLPVVADDIDSLAESVAALAHAAGLVPGPEAMTPEQWERFTDAVTTAVPTVMRSWAEAGRAS